MTKDMFLIDGRIYWTLWYSAWLRFKIHYYTRTSVQSRVRNSSCSVAASNGGRSPSSAFPNCTRALGTSFSQQQLTTTEPQRLSNSLTDMKGFRPLEQWDHGFDSHWRHVCLRLFCGYVVLCRYRPCVGLIPHPRNPTDYLKLRNWCPTLQSGSNRK
jgi:hypothetical protein